MNFDNEILRGNVYTFSGQYAADRAIAIRIAAENVNNLAEVTIFNPRDPVDASNYAKIVSEVEHDSAHLLWSEVPRTPEQILSVINDASSRRFVLLVVGYSGSDPIKFWRTVDIIYEDLDHYLEVKSFQDIVRSTISASNPRINDIS
jgi:hypothetical protein